jgi:hypothetical protein
MWDTFVATGASDSRHLVTSHQELARYAADWVLTLSPLFFHPPPLRGSFGVWARGNGVAVAGTRDRVEGRVSRGD